MVDAYFCIDASPTGFQQTEKIHAQTTTKLNAIALLNKEWPQNYILKIKFLNGHQILHYWVIESILQNYQPYINLTLKFVTDPNEPADIRVTFDRNNNGSWSFIGTDAWSVYDQTLPTMNIAVTNTGIGVVLHEFGHAIGPWGHEHQSPYVDIQWDVDKVVSDLADWTYKEIMDNIVNPYGEHEVQEAVYDITSIMHYKYDPSWTLNGIHTQNNSSLSPGDIKSLRKTYPFA